LGWLKSIRFGTTKKRFQARANNDIKNVSRIRLIFLRWPGPIIGEIMTNPIKYVAALILAGLVGCTVFTDLKEAAFYFAVGIYMVSDAVEG
jgi:hypothetical protein